MSLFGRKLLFQPQYSWANFSKTTAGDFSVNVPAGTYRILITGGGGQGGANTSNWAGAGGPGKENTYQIVLTKPGVITGSVGVGGGTVGEHNGGPGGNKNGESEVGGTGGDGGRPSYLKLPNEARQLRLCAWINDNGTIAYSRQNYGFVAGATVTLYYTDPDAGAVISFVGTAQSSGDSPVDTPDGVYRRFITNDIPYAEIIRNGWLEADGGGGGGGAGGSGVGSRYAGGAGGGGGGGRYYFAVNTGQVVSVPGKSGGWGAGVYGSGAAGVNGDTSTFPSVFAGAGGSGYRGGGGAGGTGGGAGGGGGGGGKSNDDSGWKRRGGGGGGGAGGDSQAGGGYGGLSINDARAGAGYNHYTTPLARTRGQGGAPSGGVGNPGAVYIEKIG